MTTLDYFDAYVAAGLQVIPLYRQSKVPVGCRWNGSWDRARSRAAVRPDSNLGILLGTVVDVEGDTPEANRLLDRICDGYPHPMYRSSKSVHHLFVNPDPALTILKVNGVEFRANRHQSVLPPSTHETGSQYAWLLGTTFPVPQMPEALLAYYRQHRPPVKRPELKPGHVRPWCGVCRKQVYVHGRRYQDEKIAFAELDTPWACWDCRRAAGIDVREAVRRIRKDARRKYIPACCSESS